MSKKETALIPRALFRDPFSAFRQMTAEFDRIFSDASWPSLWAPNAPEGPTWLPGIDVFEKDNRLVTRVDLPGMKKEDVKVEVTDGYLAISGERTRETEDKKERFYRLERETGTFYRTVPLPDGVKLDDVKATFADGVLEVSVPLPAAPAATMRKVEIEEPFKSVKPAA